MNRPVDFLALMLITLAAFFLLPRVMRRQKLSWKSIPVLFAGPLICFAVGVGLVPTHIGFWMTMTGLAMILVLGVVLAMTSFWSSWAALLAATSVLLGLGSWTGPGMASGLTETAIALCSLEITQPYWLLLLLLLPLLLVRSHRHLGFRNERERKHFFRWVVPLILVGIFLVALLFHFGNQMSRGLGYADVLTTPRSHYLLLMCCLIPVSLLLLQVLQLFVPKILGLDPGIMEWKPWLSLVLRSAGLSALALALAEPRLRQENSDLTVLFMVDRSLSIPEELTRNQTNPGLKTDLRVQRILDFINRSVELRGPGHERDRAGMVVFGKRPRLELTPTDAPRFNLSELPPAIDPNYTDIGAALKLALASFPDGMGKRMVLISDGNENMGNAMEQAQLARSLGVQIDVLPLASGSRNQNEVLVERVEAPPLTEQGASIPIRVVVRSFNPNIVEGRLTLKQSTERERDIRIQRDGNGGLGVVTESLKDPRGVKITALDNDSPLAKIGFQVGDEILRIDNTDLAGPDRNEKVNARGKPGATVIILVRRDTNKLVGDLPVRLRLGLNSFSFTRPLSDEQRSYTYEAEFFPLRIRDEQGKLLQEGNFTGDRVQNNRASTHVVARGQRRILILENRTNDHENEVANPFLVEKLLQAGDRKFRVDVRSVSDLNNFPDREKLSVFLSDYDCIALVNIPAERISESQQEVLRSNTHDQGCGLVMIGGPEGFGAGGWQNTAIEKALPVDCEIKSLKVQAKGGLVMIMHASELANGNFWQKKIAKLAVERLGPGDMVGIIDFDFQPKWHVPFQEIGGNKAGIMALIDSLVPGDMPDFDPALILAHKELTRAGYNLGTKHCIVISDGDPAFTVPVLAPFKRDKVSITTVGVATHGATEDNKMASIAKQTGGRTYSVRQADQLPAIYIKESRIVSQSFVEEKRFNPILAFRSGPTEKLPDPPPLTGFVRTTAKQSPLVEVPMLTPLIAEQQFPLLSYWHYGLGKSIAFTSDAGDPKFWSRGWLEGGGGEGIYARFWEQVVEWSLRPTESNRLLMTTDVQDGKIHIVVEARDTQNQPNTQLQIRGGITTPTISGSPRPLRFIQKNSGQYEADIKAEEAGSYFITAQATRLVKIKGKDGKEREVEEGIDSVRTGVTLPYSPEFADMESNSNLLYRIADLTGGKRYEEDSVSLAQANADGIAFRQPLTRNRTLKPLWPWLIFIAGCLFFLDIASRRINLSSSEILGQAKRFWARLRGQEIIETSRIQYLERLQNRQGQTKSSTGTRRFEGPPASLPQSMDSSNPVSQSTKVSGPNKPAPKSPPPPPGESLDRLLGAKKKIWDERKEE